MYNPHWHGKKSYGADGCGYEQRFTGNGGILPAGKTGVLNQDARSLPDLQAKNELSNLRNGYYGLSGGIQRKRMNE